MKITSHGKNEECPKVQAGVWTRCLGHSANDALHPEITEALETLRPPRALGTLDQQIKDLEVLRLRIAAMGKTLADRDLEARTLRLMIETELREQGTVKTEAEKLAKADQRYLSHERASIQLGYDRDVCLAQAEAARLNVELELAALRRLEVS